MLKCSTDTKMILLRRLYKKFGTVLLIQILEHQQCNTLMHLSLKKMYSTG